LLELTTLVNAILYTQGETGFAGELKPLGNDRLGRPARRRRARACSSRSSKRSARPAPAAWSCERRVRARHVQDLRLVKPALGALDDPYPESASSSPRRCCPVRQGDLAGASRRGSTSRARGGGHVKRLQLIHRLDPEGSRELVQQALNEGSKEMKVAAVECLGTSDDDLTYLMDQAKAKAKDVRAAALRALAAAGTRASGVVATLKKAIAGVDLEMILARVKTSPLLRDSGLRARRGRAMAGDAIENEG
jgi:hypothetical protein